MTDDERSHGEKRRDGELPEPTHLIVVSDDGGEIVSLSYVHDSDPRERSPLSGAVALEGQHVSSIEMDETLAHMTPGEIHATYAVDTDFRGRLVRRPE